MYYGDYALESTFDIKFTTRRFSTGAPFTLAGTPAVAAYPGNATTELTAGITLTVDFDARTGLNNVRVVATAANGYAAGTNYALVITAGTVDGVSVVGEVIGGFSLDNRSALRPTVAGRTLDVTATGGAGIDWSNVENPTTAVNLSGTNIKTDQVVASVSGAVGSVTGLTASNLDVAVSSRMASYTQPTGFLAATFPSGTVASTTNITGGTITTVSAVTGLTPATVHSDLDDIQARLPAALTAGGNMKSDVLAVNGSTGAAATMAILNGSTVVYNGTVTGAATTTTLVDSGLTQASADWWKGRIIIFTSVITLQATDITGFDPATDTLTFTAVTSAPTGATYVIV